MPEPTAPSIKPERDTRWARRDLMFMTRPGLFPVTNFPVLEEMRVEHERLLAVAKDRSDALRTIEEGFEDEDRAYREALDASYRTPDAPPLPERTSDEDRRRALDDAALHVHAATNAATAYAMDAVDRLRGTLPAWWKPNEAVNMQEVPPNGEAAAIAAEVTRLLVEAEDQARQARRLAEKAAQAERDLRPLRRWLVHLSHAGTDGSARVQPGSGIAAPTGEHTLFTKPEGTPVPPEWNRGYPRDQGVAQPIDEDAEYGVVEMSDPWFAEQERRMAAQNVHAEVTT